MGLGGMELVIFALIILLLFGSRLPSLMRSMGSSVSEFKKGVRESEDDSETLKLDSKNPDTTKKS